MECRTCVYLLNFQYFVKNIGAFNIPLKPVNSRLSRPKPAIKGLSCMLLPFLPRSPHLFARPPSSASANPEDGLVLFPFPFPGSSRGVPGLELCKLGLMGAELPPRIADTEEWAHRACLRIAEVTVIHSVVIRATGSTATEMFVLREFAMFSLGLSMPKPCLVFSSIEAASPLCIEEEGVANICPDVSEFTLRASLFIMLLDTTQHGCEVRNNTNCKSVPSK